MQGLFHAPDDRLRVLPGMVFRPFPLCAQCSLVEFPSARIGLEKPPLHNHSGRSRAATNGHAKGLRIFPTTHLGINRHRATRNSNVRLNKATSWASVRANRIAEFQAHRKKLGISFNTIAFLENKWNESTRCNLTVLPPRHQRRVITVELRSLDLECPHNRKDRCHGHHDARPVHCRHRPQPQRQHQVEWRAPNRLCGHARHGTTSVVTTSSHRHQPSLDGLALFRKNISRRSRQSTARNGCPQTSVRCVNRCRKGELVCGVHDMVL